MSTLNLATVELVSTLRAAPMNGSPSSQDYNDSWTEDLADLASLAGFINDILIPMLDGLSAAIQPNPSGAPLGLEGRFIFGDTTDTTMLFFNSLSSQSLSLADSLRLIYGIIQTVQTTVQMLNVDVIGLQSQLSSTNQNDIAQALQNFAASLTALTAQVNSNTSAISAFLITFETNGTSNAVQNLLNLEAGTNITLTNTADTGTVVISSSGGGGAFEDITSGTNTTAVMVVGSGATLEPAGSGSIEANVVSGVTVSGAPTDGQVLTATSSSTADWQSPSGSQGATGTQGISGTQGVLGAQGTIGTQGQAGSSQGATGAQGTSGTNGAQGTTGAGTQGATGTSGSQGTTGSQGIMGAQGTTGAQGTSGGGSSGFSSITSGTNTTAAMDVGSGATLEPSGSGIIEANELTGGIVISGTPSSGQVLTATSSTAADWQSPSGEFNPNQVTYLEDFTTIGTGITADFISLASGVGYGNVGFCAVGVSAASTFGSLSGSGPFPFTGFMWLSNNNIASDGTFILPAWSYGVANAADVNPPNVSWETNKLPLLENPGWQITIIFRLMNCTAQAPGTDQATFSATKKAIYIGVCGDNPWYDTGLPSSRPNIFAGLRFDTSTSGASINDTFYTLEIVNNAVQSNYTARLNTQGSTYVTNVAPAVETIHRVDIICSTAGTITVTLDQSGTNTLTASMAQTAYVIEGAFEVIADGIVGNSQATGSGVQYIPFGCGSQITYSGITSAAFEQLNGNTYTLRRVSFAPNVSFMYFMHDQGTLTSESSTVLAGASAVATGYPALYPCIMFGNDDTATPTAYSMEINVDKIYFNWVG